MRRAVGYNLKNYIVTIIKFCFLQLIFNDELGIYSAFKPDMQLV
jgi:hypothetical protein